MSAVAANDILRQEELRIKQRFEPFGTEVCEAICRIFARFGHFKLLLQRLQIEATGTVEEQQRALIQCLNAFGSHCFLEAVEKGVNPGALWRNDTSTLPDELPGTLVLAGLNPNGTGMACRTWAEDPVTSSTATNEAASPAPDPSERRKKSPGRRQKVTFDFPNDRRKAPCRRQNT